MGTAKSQPCAAAAKSPAKLELDRPGSLAENRAKIKAAIEANRETLRRLAK